MPGTADSVVDHKPVAERAMVMRAMSADRKHFLSATYQENLFVADVTD
jgi:hypothetical protein